MSDSRQHDYRFTELDPDLLSTPFRIQTNWHVITGTVSSGKTNLIDHLADKGYQTVPETGRLCFEREIAKGRTADEIRENMAAIQIAIKDMQLEIEHGLRADDVVFLDGAVPGSLAWSRAYGLDPNEMLADCFHHRYASIFILDPLPFQENGARNGDAPIAGYLDKWLARDYSALGYSVVRVPVLPPEERLAFVLERLSEGGLI
ncbi:MAG: ATP-binding protein [Anaerolineaceae bacterium]|nr:MAG: ATP-binding protein [Anaerolineaceae bacterium]